MKRAVALVAFQMAVSGFAFAVNPAMPVIPATTFNVTNNGAVGDGETDNTTSIQNTINAASTGRRRHRRIPGGHFFERPPYSAERH